MISPPTCSEAGLECRLGLGARRPVVDQSDDALRAVLDRPFGERPGLRRDDEAGAHEIGRLGRGDRGARAHAEGRLLGLGNKLRDGERARRDAGADDVDLVVDDHFLDQAMRRVGDAGVVADDQLDLAAGDGVAVLLHIDLECAGQFAADGGKARAGQWQTAADLERGVGGDGRARQQSTRRGRGDTLENRSALHVSSSPVFVLSCPRLSRASTLFRATGSQTWMAGTSPAMASEKIHAGSRCGISGRSPCALPVIGGRGRRAVPLSMTKVCSSEYHGALTSGAPAYAAHRDARSCRSDGASRRTARRSRYACLRDRRPARSAS